MLRRAVDAALPAVEGDGLPWVDELQAAADGVRQRLTFGMLDAVEGQQQAADRIGRAAAVVHQFREGCIAFLHHVLAEGVEQVAEQLQRQPVLGDGRPQALENRILRGSSRLQGIQFGAISAESA